MIDEHESSWNRQEKRAEREEIGISEDEEERKQSDKKADSAECDSLPVLLIRVYMCPILSPCFFLDSHSI